MSWLSDRTGIHINSINDLTSGRAVKEALHNPLVDAGLALAIPGVGGLVGKGIGALTSLGKFGGSGDPGGGDAGGIGDVTGDMTGGGGGGGGFMDWAKGIISGGGADGKGNFGTAGDLLGKAFGGGNGWDKALLAGSVGVGALDQARKQGLQNRAIDYATSNYDANAPLRDQARSMLMDRSTPDLSRIFGNPGNPYAAQHQTQYQLPAPAGNPGGVNGGVAGPVTDPRRMPLGKFSASY